MTKARKSRLALSDQKFIDEKSAIDWPISKISKHIGITDHRIRSYLARKEAVRKTQGEMALPTKIRSLLKENDAFGKFHEENKEYIVELYREGIPPKIIGDLLGLEHSYDKKYVETGGFYEKREITFKDECKQAQAESKIKLIMAATTDPKPNDALRFLTANESTRSMYKAPKEERSVIKIEFPGFSRGEPEDMAGEAPNFSELKEKPKLN